VKHLVTGIITAAIFSGCAGTPPDNIGVTNGALTPCPKSPNCVSSQAPEDDSQHFIQPFTYSVDLTVAHDALIRVLEEDGSIAIVANEPSYIRAEARTKIMRFVDDLEFYFPEDEQVIHVRSASRLGYGDMGTNRRRMEGIREAFAAAASGS